MASDIGEKSLNEPSTDAVLSDESLVAAVLALGDEVAFAALMQRHQRQVYYLLLRLTRNPAMAEDLCQETFLRAWSKLDRFEARGSFAGWLCRLAYNLFLRQHRRQPPAGSLESLDAPGSAARSDDELSTPDRGSVAPELERLLSVVSDIERTLLVLTYAGGLSAAEIATMLELPVGTVKSQIHRAREKIRAKFAIEVGV